MNLETLWIPGRDRSLSALRYLPDRGSRDIVLIYTHGFTSGKYSLDLLASYLAGQGYEGVTFDVVGHKLGATGGEMRSIVQAAENLQDVLAWTRAHAKAKQVVLIGHSMGGAASLQVAAWEPSPPRPPSLQGKREKNSSPILAGVVAMCVGDRPAQGFTSIVGKTMLTQRSNYVAGAPALQLVSEIKELVEAVDHLDDLPALFLAARQDVLVPVADVERLAMRAGPHATFTLLDGSHLEAPERARVPILRWLDTLKITE